MTETRVLDGTETTVVVVHADGDAAARMTRAIGGTSVRVRSAPLASLLAGSVTDRPPDLIVVGEPDIGDSASRTVSDLKRRFPATLVVPILAAPRAETVVAAFRAGAWDVLLDPVDGERLRALVGRAVDVRRAGRARAAVLADRADDRDPFRRVLGNSPEVRRLVETLREVARTDATVLITGESGTGKGLVARAIHDASARAGGAFVEANCVVYSEGILHSELFGHEKGAFTGASRQKKGRFELAQGGTIFLDEIGEITPATQLMLLRVLHDRSFERVGGEETIRTDARLIAATNADLEGAMRRGAFRSDLYYRLDVIPVRVPPLRAHLEDVPLLATRFLQEAARRSGRPVEAFTPEALDRLARHAWPGNVRELENLVERLVVLARGSIVGVEDLPESVRGGRSRAATGPGTLRSMEAARIVEALRDCGGNKKLAAVRLGIHRATLYAKMRRYGIGGAAGPR